MRYGPLIMLQVVRFVLYNGVEIEVLSELKRTTYSRIFSAPVSPPSS